MLLVIRRIYALDKLTAHISCRAVVQLNLRPLKGHIGVPGLLHKPQYLQRITRILFAQDRAIGIGSLTDPHTLAFNRGTAHHLEEPDAAIVSNICLA